MSSPDQRQANHQKIGPLFDRAANGDPHARRYLEIIAGAARVLDDLWDGDVRVSREDALLAFYGALVELPSNPFWMKHGTFLTALNWAAINAWLDANELAKGDPTERIYAHVLRDQINEILPAVAHLTGGWKLAREVSTAMRAAFKKEMH